MLANLPADQLVEVLARERRWDVLRWARWLTIPTWTAQLVLFAIGYTSKLALAAYVFVVVWLLWISRRTSDAADAVTLLVRDPRSLPELLIIIAGPDWDSAIMVTETAKRRLAAEGRETFDLPTAVYPRLIEALAESGDRDFVAVCIDAMGRIGDPVFLPKLDAISRWRGLRVAWWDRPKLAASARAAAQEIREKVACDP